ncbi:tRNA (adenosine(37)-N6)-threonylcarbamoyltransferase complex dimerization subunit type 1 TsaB [Sellimonas caecigallum]|uniref:tRNA (Adenosine(37)-N6)-threonylcarbamoyltransferase complex dimerization subunit type 1 TsaB n=1 Tax=Sellimonas caecigallum TaxID=2592333 RepID=A0ABS7L737_9FIRM|nr:tRNA (adenosine(37)-N6)-threonylcarbamoyltransferase complex dimerization subunit type 1 TsaB [Sellimonas caecigallum]MBY0758904.1 tRNA (adenosine(37)-N6)-threonylcarbamoyltransferase complex dimerization subunit type 1 TsaB [Sellimonas caecigallum]OUP66787.1 tRNA (adenosine(37)-N6)-threonylcarbamoyltransferase complex dimerization subunit type 1 TsaB [Drancourtella sp. An177]
MRILAMDSSGLTASIAVVEEEQILCEYTMNYKKTHSQTLLPMLDDAVRMTGLSLDSIDAIAVAGGPGSFTGLRIGSATAKGLGLALDKPLIHIPTVDAMAYRLYGFGGLICPIMDARRNQVYTGVYRFENSFEIVERQMAEDIVKLAELLNSYGEKVVFLGDGVPVYKEKIRECVTVPFSFAPPHLNRQSAAAVGALGLVYAKEGKLENARDHQPDYLRVSQAERERMEREKGREE